MQQTNIVDPRPLLPTDTSSQVKGVQSIPVDPGLIQSLLAHPLVTEALKVLDTRLPADLYYHNKQHTLSVIEATVACAQRDGLPERDIELLAIAAAWHDTGYIVQRQANEPIGAEMARLAMLRAGGFRADEIADVVTAIHDTQVCIDPESASLVQKASGRLSPWLLDGDLSHFGSERFFHSSLSLYRELTGSCVRSVEDLQEQSAMMFVAGTLRMLNRHEFQTAGAQGLFGMQKERATRKVGNLLAQLVGGNERSRQSAWDTLM